MTMAFDDIEKTQVFEALFNQTTTPISVVKANPPKFTIVAFNEQYKKTSNTTTDDFIGKDAFDVYKSWDKESEEQFSLLKKGLEQSVEEERTVMLPILYFQVIGEDKAIYQSWIQIEITPLLDSNCRIEYLMCITRNITEQQLNRLAINEAKEKEDKLHEQLVRVNEELHASNEELQSINEELRATNEKLMQSEFNLQKTEANEKWLISLLNALPQIAWSSTLTGEVEFYNKRWYDYTGLDFEQSKAWGWKEIIHPDDLQYNLDTYQCILNGNTGGEFEIRERGKDGIYRWHLIRVEPIKNEHGELLNWIGTATDIDDLKHLQQQKDDFISIASHELKTPITSLKASIQLLERMKDNPSPQILPVLVSQSSKSMKKISAMVEDLLNVTKINRGQLELCKATFTLSELLKTCCNDIRIAGDYELIFEGDDKLQVYADEHQVDQVIVNLVNNAVKYAPNSIYIYLIVEKDGEEAKVSVKDNGPGIDLQKIPHLFDRYYRVEPANYHSSGLGLGLYISAEIIKKHGGRIGVDSEAGKGSTFWFTLPLSH
jgi:PAS domain S-box-containing protein